MNLTGPTPGSAALQQLQKWLLQRCTVYRSVCFGGSQNWQLEVAAWQLERPALRIGWDSTGRRALDIP